MPKLIEVENLVKTYGKGQNQFKALSGVTFSINAGESVAIIGKSGSGKSTLMHLLALLDSPSEGTLTFNGIGTTTLKRAQIDKVRNEEFGFVFQQFFLNANDTVLDNVILPLKIAGVPGKERNRRGLNALKSVELEDKAMNKAVNLSGGQKQRVAIARALINDPKVIFADEPTGNLDTATGEKVEDLLFSLNKEKGITLIIVTHDPELADRCQRQIRVKDGLIENEGKK